MKPLICTSATASWSAVSSFPENNELMTWEIELEFKSEDYLILRIKLGCGNIIDSKPLCYIVR